MRACAILIFLLTVFSCSSSPAGAPADHDHSVEMSSPSWVRQPARTVDGGYIVYVGVGEDHAPERSHFKAEAMALQDLSNECSFAPKGTRIEDHFDEVEYGIHKTYAKIAVEFQECEAAKKAVTPEQIRTLASAPLAEQVKRYQELIDNPEPQEASPLEVASNSETSALLQDTGGTPSSQGSSVVVIRDTPTFFVFRQQVAYVKQDVILAPPAQYPQNDPITTRPIQTVAMAGSSIQQYEAANPQLKQGNQTFSNTRRNWEAHRPTALRQGPPAGTLVRGSTSRIHPAGADTRPQTPANLGHWHSHPDRRGKSVPQARRKKKQKSGKYPKNSVGKEE